MRLNAGAIIRMVPMIFAAALLCGCASQPRTFANTAPGADLSRYTTFGFLDKLATDNDGYEAIDTMFLKVAMTQELDRRGLKYSETPELKVNFFINTKDKIRSRSVPTMGSYFAYRDPFYDPWAGYGGFVGHETIIDQYTEGTLNIDFIDAATNKLVWEGAVAGRLTDEHIRNLERTIDQAVRDVMKNFPVAPRDEQGD